MASDQQHGLLLIPDISGFTQFVNEVEISHSEHIITELLGLLIDANSLNLTLCEIEGDALFFYRGGELPPFADFSQQVNRWYTQFHQHLRLLARDSVCKCGACQNIGNLGLKVVAHVGDFAVYNLREKIKVIGKDVILVHRLLKNSLEISEYLLLSQEALNQMDPENSDGMHLKPAQEEYEVLGKVPVAHADLSPLLKDLPALPERDAIPELDSEFRGEIVIDAPLARVVEAILDLENYPKWFEGLPRVNLNREEPIRPGHHHICEFPGQPLSITVKQIVEARDEFTLVSEIVPPPILKRMVVVDLAKQLEQGTRFIQSYRYNRKPVVGRIFDMKFAPAMRKAAQKSLENLKVLLESEAPGAKENT